ncbi:MAG: AbrB/MazE/SpoVT family DNA-binding domain-containing protein [Chloroflexi bacterium]|nr:AbrB/MazE/SpoVT family DNA-binding domain-containing protein [Chloroflexota bacterium]
MAETHGFLGSATVGTKGQIVIPAEARSSMGVKRARILRAGSGRRERAASAVERKPAQLVAQPLVVEHKFSDLVGELGALPLALQAASRLALVISRCRPRRPDRVGRGAELVSRHMAHRGGLAGSVGGMPCCPTQVSGSSVCMAGRRAGLCPRDPTPRPGPPEVDRPTWTVVLRPCLLEVVQHMLRAISRPPREKTMIVVLEDPTATHG